jgi:hypothetical protein
MLRLYWIWAICLWTAAISFRKLPNSGESHMPSIRRIPFQLFVLLLALAFGVSASGMAGKRKNNDQNQNKDKSNSAQIQQQNTSGTVDLNTASEKELDALPGVGPVTVKKIISNRPYSSVDDLKKADLAQAQIEKIRPLVTVSSTSSTNASSSNASTVRSESATNQSGRQSSALPQSDNATAAPAAGSGKVWVNLDSKIYHYEGDRWYGNTKHGQYMSEADAQKAGYRAAKNGKGKE